EDPAWEPVWSQLEDLDVPLGFHEGNLFDVAQLGADRSDSFMFVLMMIHPFEHMAAMLAMIAGGVCERHPKLRIAHLESGCGWVPYWLERMEYHVDEFGPGAPMSLRPTEYFHRQFLISTD